MRVRCPVCGLPVEVPDDVMEGEVVEHDCGATLEVRFEGNAVRLVPLDGVADDWGE
ncbi:MAG: sulfonate ABC transporter [Desulfurococcales archaeon]|nr:sulfonate ABC transporter [Desulfurococcales archaeon]